MKRAEITALVLPFLLVVPGLCAVERQYQPGEIVAVEQKTRSRVLYYLVNTPITRDEPYYEVSVKLKGTVYVGESTPFHPSETLPDDWREGGWASHVFAAARGQGTAVGDCEEDDRGGRQRTRRQQALNN